MLSLTIQSTPTNLNWDLNAFKVHQLQDLLKSVCEREDALKDVKIEVDSRSFGSGINTMWGAQVTIQSPIGVLDRSIALVTNIKKIMESHFSFSFPEDYQTPMFTMRFFELMVKDYWGENCVLVENEPFLALNKDTLDVFQYLPEKFLWKRGNSDDTKNYLDEFVLLD